MSNNPQMSTRTITTTDGSSAVPDTGGITSYPSGNTFTQILNEPYLSTTYFNTPDITIHRPFAPGWRYVEWDHNDATHETYARVRPIVGTNREGQYVVAGSCLALANEEQFVCVLPPGDATSNERLNALADDAYRTSRARALARSLTLPSVSGT